mmetsp:Transcript_79880/g.162571  ORF Transcript_79880/g.162571 Transcript_79880/m.162571 type:complete len:269 (-) Transcript_79880:1267-2073(-)
MKNAGGAGKQRLLHVPPTIEPAVLQRSGLREVCWRHTAINKPRADIPHSHSEGHALAVLGGCGLTLHGNAIPRHGCLWWQCSSPTILSLSAVGAQARFAEEGEIGHAMAAIQSTFQDGSGVRDEDPLHRRKVLGAEEVIEDLILNIAGHATLVATYGFQALGFEIAGAALGRWFGVCQATIALLREAQAGHVDLFKLQLHWGWMLGRDLGTDLLASLEGFLQGVALQLNENRIGVTVDDLCTLPVCLDEIGSLLESPAPGGHDGISNL